MTAKQFKRWRKKFFHTQVEAAETMGVSLSSVEKWERGARVVPQYIMLLMNCMEMLERRQGTTKQVGDPA